MIQKAYSKSGRACRVTFKVPTGQVDAESGAVLGEFNGWRPDAHRLERRKDGSLSLTVSLPVGREYRFRYLFDGAHWANDESADAYIPNLFGTQDSVLVLTEPAGVATAGRPADGPAAAAAPRPKAAASPGKARKPSPPAAPRSRRKPATE